MKMGILDICNNVMDKYKEIRDELRFDGEYINHFASLIFGGVDKKPDIDKIKKIRKEIKKETSQLSSFRGDILYILSILISKEDNYKVFSENLIRINEDMQDMGFKESDCLALASYAICKHGEKENYPKIFNNTKLIYDLLRKEFKDITDENDYLICALLGIKCAKENEDIKETGEFVEYMFNYLLNLKEYSRNHLQLLATSALLNENINAQVKVKELINSFREKDMIVGEEFLGIIGIANKEESISDYIEKVKIAIEYLYEEDGTYSFYMDKTFRVMIGIIIVEYYNLNKNKSNNEYLEELLAFSIVSFLGKKKQSMLIRKEEEKVYI
ncbi:MAG: DUF4003 family protein [Clostridium sp.]|uniref:DUF4003 family protein n=1 Tax=Clostridium sp. TaxID=1506 RepID=UPI003F377734